MSEVSLHRHCTLKTPVLIGWVIISLIGGGLIVRSAMPYNGKLAWYIDEIRNTKSMVLIHDNIYEDKLSGVLEDIRQKVDLPQTLCFATSFSLHFKPDGTIVSLDVMLKGFDDEGNYIDSYLISYNRNHSNKIRVDLHGIANGVYEQEKDFNMLTEGMKRKKSWMQRILFTDMGLLVVIVYPFIARRIVKSPLIDICIFQRSSFRQ